MFSGHVSWANALSSSGFAATTLVFDTAAAPKKATRFICIDDSGPDFLNGEKKMERLIVGLEWFLNPDHVPLLIARRLGWFEDAGIDLRLVEPEQHLDAVDEIERGEMDLAITEPLHLVEDRAEGKPVVGFARFLHTNGGVMYLEDSDIERPRDMAGKRIQYPGAPGPGGPAIVQTMIETDGGECQLDNFEPVNNGFFHTDALLENKADVATLVFYNFEVLEARYRGHDANFFALKDWGVPDFCQLIFITHPETLKRRRDTIATFVDLLRQGIDFLHQHPEKPGRSTSKTPTLTSIHR